MPLDLIAIQDMNADDLAFVPTKVNMHLVYIFNVWLGHNNTKKSHGT